MIAYGRFHFHSLSNTPRSPTYDFRPMGPLVQVLDAETSKDVLVCDALDEAGWWWWWWLYMIKWLLSWFNRYYLIFVPVQFKLKPKKTLVIPCPIYIHTHIYIYTQHTFKFTFSCWRRPQPAGVSVGATARISPLNWALVGKLRRHHRDSD